MFDFISQASICHRDGQKTASSCNDSKTQGYKLIPTAGCCMQAKNLAGGCSTSKKCGRILGGALGDIGTEFCEDCWNFFLGIGFLLYNVRTYILDKCLITCISWANRLSGIADENMETIHRHDTMPDMAESQYHITNISSSNPMYKKHWCICTYLWYVPTCKI